MTALRIIHDVSIQIPRLHEIDVAKLVGVARGRPGYIDGRRGHGRIRGRTAEAIGPVVGAAAPVGIKPHEAVPLIAVHGAGLGRVDRQQMIIRAEAVAVSVMVAEQPSLQHLVRRRADARHEVAH